MKEDNRKNNAPPPKREREAPRPPRREEYEAPPKTRTWGFIVGAVLLLAILTVVLCIMGGVFDFNKGASETDAPAAETQAPQENTEPPAENTPTPSPTPPEESEAPEIHTVNAIAGNGGSISPSGIVEVEDGGSVTFTITADPGYVLSELKVDGYTAELTDSFTFPNVTGEHTIYAIFREEVVETPPPTPTETPVETEDPFWPYITLRRRVCDRPARLARQLLSLGLLPRLNVPGAQQTAGRAESGLRFFDALRQTTCFSPPVMV